MMLYQQSCRFDALKAEMFQQRFTQVQADSQVGFACQKLQHSLNGQIQVNLAQEFTGVETEISGGTRKRVTHGGNNFFAADLCEGEQALVGQEAKRMAQVADEHRHGCLQPHLSRQFRHQRLQPFAGIVAKVMNLLGKEGHDLPLILVCLTSERLNDPKGMAQIEFLDVVLVPVGLAILPQRLPELFGVPSEQFEPFTESHLLFRIEMRSVENLRCMSSDQANVGVAEQSGQVEVITMLLLWLAVKVTLQLGNDPNNGLFGLREEVEVMSERKGSRPAISLDGLDRQRHETVVGAGQTVEIVNCRVPNVEVGMQDGFLDFVFGVSHDAFPVQVMSILSNYASSSAYCG